MSLRVWLPLNGDLRNNGLSNTVITNNGTTVDNNGKIGKCYSFDGTHYIDTGFYEDFGTGDFTLCAWIYLTKVSGKTYQAIISNKTTAGKSVGCAIYWHQDQKKFLWSTADGTTATEIWSSDTFDTIVYDSWHHIAMIRNNSDSKKGYFYFDGVRKEIASIPAIRNVSNSTYTLKVGALNPMTAAYTYTGKINDVRIYDHALSAKEVKELSKGLVCHYKLDSSFIEPTTNLVTTEDCLSSTCYNGATNKYGYGTNTDMYKTVGVFEGRKCTKLYMGTSGLSARPYPYVSNLFVSNGTNQPEYKTLSFDYYGTIGAYIHPYKLGSGSSTCNWTNSVTDIKNGVFTNGGDIPVVANKWNHITMTLHGTTDANAEWGYIIMGDAHTSDVNNYWLFANMQIETKDHETGYAGVGGTRNENIIYDSSGYNNHAESVGNPIVSSSTIRNSLCTHFINGQYGIVKKYVSTYLPKDAITVNLWMNCSTWGLNPISCTEGGGWNFENSSSNLQFQLYVSGVGYKPANSGVTINSLLNSWHMITGTFNSSEVKIYIDGELKKTTETGSTNGIGYASNYLCIGAEAQGTTPASSTFVGDISDVRIYATALNENDIKELYQAPISISNNGSIFTQGEYVEV